MREPTEAEMIEGIKQGFLEFLKYRDVVSAAASGPSYMPNKAMNEIPEAVARATEKVMPER